MKVVEQPVGRRRDELPGPHVVGEGPIGGAQHTNVVFEAREGVTGAVARVGIDREAGSQRERTFLEPLDAEQLVAKRFVDRRWLSMKPGQDACQNCRGRMSPRVPADCSSAIRSSALVLSAAASCAIAASPACAILRTRTSSAAINSSRMRMVSESVTTDRQSPVRK
jgi:hypothetical protein